MYAIHPPTPLPPSSRPQRSTACPSRPLVSKGLTRRPLRPPAQSWKKHSINYRWPNWLVESYELQYSYFVYLTMHWKTSETLSQIKFCEGEAAETVSTSSGLIGQTTLIKVPWGWGRKHKEFYINVWCRPPHPSLMLPHQFEIMFHACRCRKQGLNW